MPSRRGFSRPVLSAISQGKIMGVRAGRGAHRFIGVWMVVVDGRVFVRSWGLKPGGWYRTFLEERWGALTPPGSTRAVRVRAVPIRSERLKAAVDRAYREKYDTPGSLKYVRGLNRGRRRDSTLELVPASS